MLGGWDLRLRTSSTFAESEGKCMIGREEKTPLQRDGKNALQEDQASV